MSRQAIILFLVGLVMLGCETEVDVFKLGESTPVVYCILNQDTTVQSLRLSRSYNSSLAAVAPDSPDSLLFDRALDIVLEKVQGSSVVKRTFFIPVDVKKDEGFFPYTEHWIYQTDMQVLPNTTYRLIIYLSESEKIVYSTCTTVTPFDIINPAYPEVRLIHLQTDHNPQFSWTKSNNAGIYQFGFSLHYDEYIEDRVTLKTVNLFLNTTFMLESAGHYYTQSINSAQFYIRLHDLLTADPAIIRKCTGVDAIVLCGGEELAYLVRLQQGGQTFNIMEYSNILNGVGVFSSRLIRQVNGFKLTNQTIDSLAYGKYTHDLNFLDRNGIREGGGG
ncbi:MAG: hypothetical protein J7L89_01565 [Bacteroidales bacterium]|nr:hypothetical protein [Bacteroidales bacterium]